MNTITNEVIKYFETLSEYELRTYLRDCVDIFAYDKKDLESLYPVEVFNFLKLARIVKHKETPREFVESIEEITNFDEKSIKDFVSIYVSLAEETLTELENNLRRIKQEYNYLTI